MRRFIRIICAVMVICVLFSFPAQASEVEARASSFIGAHDAFLYKTTANTFQVWFDVSACTGVTKLGAKQIIVYRSADQQTWTKMRTYSYEDYPDMMDYNSGSHAGYVIYQYASSGYYYRAHITFYAENSSGSGTVFRYTAAIKM